MGLLGLHIVSRRTAFSGNQPHVLSSQLVRMTGLEPAASCSQSKHSTKLSYIRICKYIFIPSNCTDVTEDVHRFSTIKYIRLYSVCTRRPISHFCRRRGNRKCEPTGQEHKSLPHVLVRCPSFRAVSQRLLCRLFLMWR